MTRWIGAVVTIFLLCLAGCQVQYPEPVKQRGAATFEHPAAVVGGRRLDWVELRPVLVEMAGGQALTEIVLGQLVEQCLIERSLALTQDMIDTERAIVASTLGRNSDQAARLLKELRQRKGWGPTRFEAMLHRNAGLRLLVQDQVDVTDEAVVKVHQLMYGPKYQVRMIMVATLRDATDVMRRARAGEFFPDLALEQSNDVSGLHGGLLEPISPGDASWPRELRDTLTSLAVGQISEPIMLERGFSIVKLEKKIDAQPVEIDDGTRPDLVNRVRRHAERILTQNLARQLIVEADVSVFDPALNKVWRQWLNEMLNPPAG